VSQNTSSTSLPLSALWNADLKDATLAHMSKQDENPQDAKSDVVLVGGPTEKGDGVRVLRARENAIELGELRSVKEGEAIKGDLVRLKKRQEHARLFDVEVVLPKDEPKPASARAHAGPAQVASDAYRRNWESVFGPPPTKRELLN